MTKKIFIKMLIFSVGLLLIISRLTSIFTLKEYAVGPNVNFLISPNILCEKQDGFYSLDDNILDVVFIGSSNIHCNVNPNVIWNEYGILSYDYSCDQQELGTTYYYLQQVFKTQAPKVIVIDVMGNGDTDEISTLQAHFAFDHMKKDIFRIKAIWNRTVDARLEMYLPIITYHERWKEISQNDYEYKPNEHNLLNGAFIYMLQNEQETPQIPNEIPEMELSERTIYWLDAIQRLCEEHSCKCVFIKTPYAFYEDSWFSYFNAIEAYCEEKDVPFLYMNNMIEEIGIDFSTDYTDTMHMNWNGQQKLSKFLGNYLVSNYGLESKKDLEQYSQWNDDYNTMLDYVNNFWNLYWQQQGQ